MKRADDAGTLFCWSDYKDWIKEGGFVVRKGQERDANVIEWENGGNRYLKGGLRLGGLDMDWVVVC